MLNENRRFTRVETSCFRKIKLFDLFGTDFYFMVGNTRKHKSVIGVLATLVLISSVIAYATLRITEMLHYNNTIIFQTEEEDHLEDDFSLDHEMGFNIAFGMTDFSSM